MKKTLVTLLAASTLAVAVAPIASALDKNAVNIQNQGVNITRAEVSREYALLAGLADIAHSENVTAQNTKNHFARELENITTAENGKIAAQQAVVDGLVKAYKDEVEKISGLYPAESIERKNALDTLALTHAPGIALAEDQLETVKKSAAETIAKAQKAFDEAAALAAETEKSLEAAQAAAAAAYNKALGLGATPAELEEAKKGAVVAPAAKPAAGVKAAATPTGQKALPKTSAAK